MTTDDSLLGKPPNRYQERISHKKYLAKKKRYHKKVSGGGGVIETSEDIFAQNRGEDVWLVSEVTPSTSGKILSCFSRQTGDTKLVELSDRELIASVVIGDYVTLSRDMVTSIVARSNLLARYKGDSDRFSLHKRILQPIAANLDYVVIVASAKNPKFQPGFVDRYMMLAESCYIPMIICISKSDLTKIDDPILRWYEESLKIPVVYTSSRTGEGISSLQDLIREKTVVFVGKSGAGKSSLINAILGADVIHTATVSEKGGQGRHTTTASKMHEWDDWSYIIDTPGIRSLDFLEFSEAELRWHFPEFDEPAQSCRFRDCLHDGEPDCGVKDAVSNGTIPESRYNTYLRLLHDIS